MLTETFIHRFTFVFAEGVDITTKRPSAGLDLIRLSIQIMIKAYQSYLQGWSNLEDGQDLVVVRRTTEGGIDVGFVQFVNGKLTSMPDNDLLKNCVIPEGLQNKFEVVNAFLNSIPRDADFKSEKWTTVDPEKNNSRLKAVLKLLAGMGFFCGLIGQNFR